MNKAIRKASKIVRLKQFLIFQEIEFNQKWLKLETLCQTSRIKLEAGGHQEQLLSVHLKLVHDANASLILGGIKLSKF